MKPQRITLQRVRGWRMPEKTIKVARGGYGFQKKYGNPYLVTVHGRDKSLRLYRDEHLSKFTPEEIRADLGGRNLACWCKEDEDCHADILLELANP